MSQQESDVTGTSSLNNELKFYRADVASLSKSDVLKDVFEYWKTKKVVFLTLFQVVSAVLAVPATSAPCERVFSRPAVILVKNRHNLSDEPLKLEIFLKFNDELFQ